MTLRTAILAVCCLALAACAVGPDYERPALDLPDAYASDIGAADAPGPTPWWNGFGDARLDRLAERALAENREIGEALARLDEASAFVDAARSDLYPALDGQVAATASEQFDGETDGAAADASALIGFTADLFGGRRRAVEAAARAAEARAAALEDARRLTVAGVALQYVELSRAGARLALLDTSLDLQQQTLEIVRRRFEAGLSARLDVRRAEADLARTRAQRGSLAVAASDARNALAVLVGGARPDEIEAAEAVPPFEGALHAGAPAELLRRRPDVRAAEADLAGATAAIGVETADLYPSLRLPGRITANLGSSSGIAQSGVAQVSAILDIPVLDAGRRRAEVAAARASARAALRRYEQTVLEALGEVERSLVAIEALRTRRDDLGEAVTASEQAFDQLSALYREGLATFIDILDAQRTLIDSREAYVNNEAELARAVIALYAALGAPVEPPASPDASTP